MNEPFAKWIIVTPGSKGEELIQSLKDFECIKAFFIFCRNIQFHENWAKKYEKVKCLTSNPEILCQNFIEFNKNFAFPNFNYPINNNNSSNVNEIQFEKLFDNYVAEIKGLITFKKLKIKKYYDFCYNSYNYLNSSNFEKDFDDNIGENPLDIIANIFKNQKKENKKSFATFVQIIKNLTILSQYFHAYPFLFHLLSFQEIKNIFQMKISINSSFIALLSNIYPLSCELSDKLLKKENIIEEKTKLKELYICVLSFIYFFLKFTIRKSSFFNNFYHIIHYFRDIVFCLKYYLSLNYSCINTRNNNIIN